MSELPLTAWLPTTKKEVEAKGWDELDVILFTGDAYVDHPSFGAAVIGRLLESLGLKVAIVAQPNWKDDLRDFKKLGTPKLFFGVTAGNMDSMINHYTAAKRKRTEDAYTAGGEADKRPDRASVVYSNILKSIYPDVPILLGGIEASLRRVTHFDYWSETVRPSILLDSKADMLVYGMGEQPLVEIVKLLKRGVPFNKLDTVKQTSILRKIEDGVPKIKSWTDVELETHEDCVSDKEIYARNFKVIETESNKQEGRRILQKAGDYIVIVNPPYPVMTSKEIDRSFDLPYTRLPHPKYKKRGQISAFEMIKFSVNTHRGCFGGCSFCTISAHQGKLVASRSQESIMKEVEQLTAMPDFKGYISDVGGPSANMYGMKGKNPDICKKCSSSSCIFPAICSNLDTSTTQMLKLYRDIKKNPKVKKAFIGSGIRYDLLIRKKRKSQEYDIEHEYIEEMVKDHVSGRLKVAPEHTEDRVLKMMRKPSFSLFYKFKELFDTYSTKHSLKQEMIPYFISSHPDCTEEDMKNLASKTKSLGFQLEQVQDFTPTPMTLATEIYYSGINPYSGKETFTAKSKDEKLKQRDHFFWYKKD